jgi:putative CocE/NonD family hydrolase
LQYVSDWPRPIREIEHLLIPMPDGKRLAARLWLPEDAEAYPVPAIIEYIPYRKRDLTARRDSIAHPYLAGHGYACLRVDLRGSGESEGILLDEYLPQELNDGQAVIRWAANQPWCTGSVGMMGISWGGFNALQLAARQPPALKAIVAVAASDDRYADDVHYMGGCLLGDNLSWASTMFAYNSSPPDPALVGPRWRRMWRQRLEGAGLWLGTWLRHQWRDEYWRHGSVAEDWTAIQCPVMAVSGWADGYSNAVFRLLENLHVPCRGLIGPWSHKYPHLGVPGPAIGFLQELVRWWDHWLKGVESGVMVEPALRVWMQHSVHPTPQYTRRPGRWVGENDWPSNRITRQRLSLTQRGLLWPGEEPHDNDRETEATVQSPLSHGLFAGKWCSYAATPDLPHDQREEDGGSLLFDTGRLERPVEILGPPVLELTLSANKPVAMIAVRLSDIAPDDQATRITYGLLNLTHRHSHADPTPLTPHQPYRVSVQLNGVAQSFPAGHRIRLAVSSSYWPLAWPPPEPARLAIHLPDCAFYLPERPPAAHDSQLRPFEDPVGAEPLPAQQLSPTDYNWRVIRDLARDVSTLEVTRDEGRWRLPDIDLELKNKTLEWYTSTANRFDSVRGETYWERAFKRDDWEVETHTRTVLTSSPSNFYLQADLDAYEGRKRVYCRSWDLTIPRQLV